MAVETMAQTSSYSSVPQAAWLSGQATDAPTDMRSVSAAGGWSDGHVAALLFNLQCNDAYVAAFLLNVRMGNRV
jgi:hypothetical protein